MAFAVSLFFDTETDRAVRGLWHAVEAAGISSFLARGPFHPHLTLAIYEHLDTGAVRDALTALAAERSPLPVSLPSIGIFPGGEGVIFLSATMTEALLSLHRQVHTLLAEHAEGAAPYYLPDRWNPHCSLARQLSPTQVAPTVALCRDLFSDTLLGTLPSIGIVETPAEVELCRIAFGDGSQSVASPAR